jgi:uncharacterized protein (DUF362 family)/Pyruvate/2-oxoacid:ferredoxin oxidoreductase delta subunit
MPRVCIIKVENEDVHKAVKTCFDNLITSDLLRGVKKALIKPNFVVGLPANSGATTDLRIIESLAKILKENGIEVYVGESSLENTSKVLEALRVLELEKLGVKIVNFDEEKWIGVQSPFFAPARFHLPEVVLDCDLIVSVAKMKTHDQTGVTLSVKNVLGLIQKSDRKSAHRVGIDKAIVSVFAYLVRNKKFVSFVDGIYGMEGKGSPTHGMPVKTDLIVAGDDALATDATCIEIMGLDLGEIKHLSLSRKIGLGEIEGRELIGEKIENVRRRFEMPPATRSSSPFLASYVLKKFFNRTSSLKYKQKCIKCRVCIENCPMGIISMEREEIKIDKKKCIGCMVCLESCKEGALDYEINHVKIYKTAKAVTTSLRKRRKLCK